MTLTERLQTAVATLTRELADTESMLNEISALKSERDDLLRQLQLFWRAKNRPWFCRNCSDRKDRGYLLPFGRDGFVCAHCDMQYVPKTDKG